MVMYLLVGGFHFRGEHGGRAFAGVWAVTLSWAITPNDHG